MDIGSSSSLSVPLQASLSDDVFATQAGDDLAKDETGSASLSATSTSKLSSGPPLREDSTPAVASKASLSTGSRRGAGSRRSKVSPRSPVRDSQQEQVAMSVPFTSASSDDVSITTTPAETAMDTTSAAVSNDVDDEVAASASPRFSRIRRGGAASPASSQAVAVTVKSDTAEEPRRGLAHASNTATATAATASRGRRSRGRAKTPDVASAETPHAMGVELESSPAVDPSPAAVSVDAAPATGAAVNDDERASTDMTTTGAASVEVDAVNDQVVPEDISVLCNVCKEVVSAHSMYIYCERCSSPVHMLCLLMTEAEINSADSLLCSDCRDKAGANAATDPSAAGAGGAGGVAAGQGRRRTLRHKSDKPADTCTSSNRDSVSSSVGDSSVNSSGSNASTASTGRPQPTQPCKPGQQKPTQTAPSSSSSRRRGSSSTSKTLSSPAAAATPPSTVPSTTGRKTPSETRSRAGTNEQTDATSQASSEGTHEHIQPPSELPGRRGRRKSPAESSIHLEVSAQDNNTAVASLSASRTASSSPAAASGGGVGRRREKRDASPSPAPSPSPVASRRKSSTRATSPQPKPDSRAASPQPKTTNAKSASADTGTVATSRSSAKSPSSRQPASSSSSSSASASGRRSRRSDNMSIKDLPLDRSLSRDDLLSLKNIVGNLLAAEESWPFRGDTSKHASAHVEAMKSKMDLCVVERKLGNKTSYKSLRDIQCDMSVIFDTCRQYNSQQSVYVRCADAMEAMFVQRVRLWLDQ
eukprot:scpid18991/ scgid0521/ Nucleosome-remodeling factor subunit NURF301; Enhancer of bithorax; Nucleosome-remodeling factor 215 kDa subunit